MRKKLLVSLCLTLLLVLTMNVAFAANCSSCGKSILSSANYCPYCGASQSSSSSLSVTRVTNNGNGTVTVTWRGGSGPYEVWYAQKLSNDAYADALNNRSFGLRPGSDRSFYGTSATISQLVPGQDY